MACRRTRRFLCREKLGSSKFTGAAFLKPVPRDAVVYGQGEHALVLTKVPPRIRCCVRPALLAVPWP